MDYDKAKRALDALSQERQAQQDRLQLAAEAKAELDKRKSIFLAKRNTMIIDQKLLDELTVQAKANPRLRQAYDLRTTSDDKSQRMLNALEPGTIMPIHRHRNTSETMVMVRGKLIERFYDDDGKITEEFVMEPCGQHPMVQIEAGQWHSLETLEEGTIIFEAKDGAYVQLSSADLWRTTCCTKSETNKQELFSDRHNM